MGVEKLTKKQLKAKQFRNQKPKPEDTAVATGPVESSSSSTEPPKKKRKTRRGKKGKGNGGVRGGNRFLVFVGQLPADVTADELKAHFKNSAPDHIRVRNDKKIAFLEFDGDKDPQNIQKRMDIALLQHQTSIRDGFKINVELTVGGGGNSQDRLEKLRTKNEKMAAERSDRMTKLILKNSSKGDGRAPTGPADTKDSTKGSSSTLPHGIHPDRAKLLQ
ncbi:Nop6p KNAG_0L02280 [Huiozyma naganishii CBS 8797]|uniref:RRM domain-containing protein n=1 Tax=Huiozyma naganishii (strain ATCC MYA-139 / BCRC 22969 / CBS 8797 / KCTC 17520 / NBRC 10181 / NCYC 3082 / Yp74L-3) TaxID=1071383 RepID=J7SAL3_HUIN7|nr:hypothetical protein KNAG_0L02280 [Kazachstania naganishii CBS 8797]CCK72844.1 hypothetical protein KNAG_0L02280 [Kazachstania naganishii CBS 8797]